jgi:hypothetical protein
MKPIERLSWIAVAMFGAALAAAQPRDPATLAPADAIACVGWTQLNDGNWELLKALDALLQDPEIAEEMEIPAAAGPAVTRFADAVTRGTAAFVLLPSGAAPVWAGAGFVVIGAEDAKRTGEAFDALLTSLGSTDRRTATIGGVTFQALPEGQSPLYWTTSDEHFVLAWSEAAAEALLSRAQGKGEALADAAEYKLDAGQMGAAEGPWCFTAFADVQALRRMATAMAGGADSKDVAELNRAFAALGVDRIASVLLRCDLVEYGPRLAMYMHTGGAKEGVLKLTDQAALTDADLAIVPQDAYWATVWNLDLVGTWEALRAIIAALDAKGLRVRRGSRESGAEARIHDTGRPAAGLRRYVGRVRRAAARGPADHRHRVGGGREGCVRIAARDRETDGAGARSAGGRKRGRARP